MRMEMVNGLYVIGTAIQEIGEKVSMSMACAHFTENLEELQEEYKKQIRICDNAIKVFKNHRDKVLSELNKLEENNNV